jgi:hypothetical protein
MIFLLCRRSVLWVIFLFAFVVSAPAVWADVYFPQIAAGGGYVTVVTLMNTDARAPASAVGRLKFYNPDGSARTVTTTELGNGSQFDVTVPYQGTRVITITSTGGLAVGTAVFEVSGVSVGGVARFSIGSDSVGVIDAKPVSLAYIPLTTKDPFGNGVAIQNPGATPVNIRLRLIKPDGTIDQTSTPAGINPLPGFGQFSKFVGPEMGFNNPVQANSTLEIAVQGAGSVTILPLLLGNGFTSSGSLVTSDIDSPALFVQVVDGGGFTTAIRLFNPTQYLAVGFLRFFSQSGAPRTLPIAGVGNVSFIPISIAAGRTVVYETTGASAGVSAGMARLDTSVAVGGLATLFYGPTHVGVPSTSAMRSGRIAVDTDGGNTGVALGTSGPNPNNLRLTLQNRDGLGSQISTPSELSPLRVNQQYARYVTEMGFTSSNGLKETSLLVETVGAGTFFPLALLDRGAFSSTATSRQRLYDPVNLAGNYAGTFTMTDFALTGGLTIGLALNGNSATVSLSLDGESLGNISGTFGADGELTINGAAGLLNQLINFRVHADGVFSILLVNLGNAVFTPAGEVRWISAFGELAPPRGSGAILIGHVDGTMANGSLTLSKQ